MGEVGEGAGRGGGGGGGVDDEMRRRKQKSRLPDSKQSMLGCPASDLLREDLQKEKL